MHCYYNRNPIDWVEKEGMTLCTEGVEVLDYFDALAARPDQWAEKRRKGYQAFDVMEQQLGATDFLVDGGYSIADIALYAHTHVAGEAEMDLGSYPAIRRWLDRVAEQPGHVLITQDDIHLDN